MAWKCGNCNIKTGTYTGDGTRRLNILDVGFKPKAVLITRAGGTGANQTWMAIDAMGLLAGAQCAFRLADDSHSNGAIIELFANGFAVDDAGSDRDPNSNGVEYAYIAWG